MRKPRKKALKSLLDIVGKGWKITYDEAWKQEEHAEKMDHRIDYERIALRGGGHLRLFDMDKRMLAVWTPRYKWARAAALLHKDIILGELDKEAELFFPFELAGMVLESGKGQKRRSMSDANREKAAERFAKYRESKKAATG